MDSAPATPQPHDHEGPSDHEGWNPTADPIGEIDVVERADSDAPGIAFVPGDPSSTPSAPDANEAAETEEVTALRERLAFYETFDSLIRDNIDRAGALMREVATRQVDAEAKLRTSTKDFERRQIEERAGYRKIFGSLLDDVSTIQQQVERLARQVSDALDDLELQLPAAGELSAMERGQAPGMTGLSAANAPSGLPSGASSSAWVTHDVDLPATSGKHATASSYQPAAEQADEPPPQLAFAPAEDGEPLTDDDLGVVEGAAGEIDPNVVEDVLNEGTDADPAVSDPAEELPEAGLLPTDLSDLPEEFGLDNPTAPGASGTVDEPYVEQSVVAGDSDVADALDTHLTSAAESEGFYVDSAPELDDLVDAAATDVHEVLDDVDDVASGETPLSASAPLNVVEHDGGLDESPAVEDVEEVAEVADATANEIPHDTESTVPYGSDAPVETGIGSLSGTERQTATGPSTSVVGEPPSKLRRFEAEAPRPGWGSVPPAPRIDATRAPVATMVDATSAGQDTIVLVHGVPRATTALSLKRYLEGLEAVTAVEPREYAEGVLRLQVTGDRPIRVSDLTAWPDGTGLQEVEIREDLVEIRLPS